MASKISRLNRTLKCQNRMWNIYFDHIKEGENEVENYFVAEPKVVAENHITGIGTLPIVDGKIGKLIGHMEHFDRRGLECYIEKHNRYSTIEAREIIIQPEKHGITIDAKFFGNVQERRRWVKQNIYPWLPAKWLFRFFWMFIIRRGILDGVNGFRFCMLVSTYEIFISLKMLEYKKQMGNKQ